MKDFLYSLIQKIPPRLYVWLRGQGWCGSYKTWAKAVSLTTGYDKENILEKVKAIHSAMKKSCLDNTQERKGKERTTLSQHTYAWEICTVLLWIASQNKACLNVLDFGGSLGTLYYQHKLFFDTLAVQWNVVEQPHYVQLGKAEFEDGNLKFFLSVEDCMQEIKAPIHCVVFGSVLQYLEKPYEILGNILNHKIRYILITRTGFTLNKPDRITIQKVPKSYYDASYPCWIFEEQKFIDFFAQHGYKPIIEYKEKYQINIPSTNKGILFQGIENK
jgi:putative methyltransferase (TIGR04325 family)